MPLITNKFIPTGEVINAISKCEHFHNLDLHKVSDNTLVAAIGRADTLAHVDTYSASGGGVVSLHSTSYSGSSANFLASNVICWCFLSP